MFSLNLTRINFYILYGLAMSTFRSGFFLNRIYRLYKIIGVIQVTIEYMTIHSEFAEYIMFTMMPHDKNTIIDICPCHMHARLIRPEFMEIPFVNYLFSLCRHCIIDNGEITGRIWK